MYLAMKIYTHYAVYMQMSLCVFVYISGSYLYPSLPKKTLE